MHSKFDDCKRGSRCIEIPQNLHGLHVGVLKHGSGHVHQGRVVEEAGQVHPTRALTKVIFDWSMKFPPPIPGNMPPMPPLGATPDLTLSSAIWRFDL